MKDRTHIKLWLLIALSLAAVGAAPFFGGVHTPLAAIISPNSGDPESQIFWFVRAPRVLAAFLAGGFLAAAGLAAQAVFQNPLASPFTLGISSGAALGAGVSIIFGAQAAALMTGQSGWALAGALLSALLVGLLGSRRESSGGYGLIVAGLVINFFFSSLLVVIQYAADPSGVFRILRWLMGGVEAADYKAIFGMGALGLAGFAALAASSSRLDILSLGDELALARGIDPNKFRKLAFILIAIISGAVVAFCGPIGFIDIIVPQAARRIWGFGHRRLFTASFFLGGLSLLLCDTIARLIIFPAEIPAGIVASILGGPLFLALLRKPRMAFGDSAGARI